MRYVIAALATGFLGCASPQRIERGAMAHEHRAAVCQKQGNYVCADRERQAAARQHAKAANRRASWYGYY